MESPYLLFCAAEPSGDQHAAHLAAALKRRRPDLRMGAFGGPQLERAGCELHEDLTAHASMVFGFISSLGRHIRMLARFDRMLREDPPTAVVLIDSPGLNFLLARLATWRKIPVVYYICPQIWAWAPWRRKKIERYTDLLMVILPFETEIYAGLDAHFVGHPLGDELAPYLDQPIEEVKSELGVAPDRRILGILPGSRAQEVEALAAVFTRLVARAQIADDIDVVVSCFRPTFRPLIEKAAQAAGLDEVKIYEGDARQLMRAADFAVVASGTASLELAFFETPMVVLYRLPKLSRAVFRYIKVTPWIALPNILGAGVNDSELTVHEEIFVDEPDEVALKIMRELLEDGEPRNHAIEKLRRLREEVLRPGGVEGAADRLDRFLSEI